MKKLRYLLVALLLGLVVLPASAQLGEERHNLAIGVTGGLNMSKVDFSPKIKQNSLNAMSAGISVRYMCEKYFKMMCGVLMELNYSQRGWSELIEDGSGNTYSRTMNYVELPFMAHLAFGKDNLKKGVKFFVNAGPQIAFFLSDNEKKGGGEWDTSHRPNGVTEQYGKSIENKFDYGIVAGAGLELSTGIGHFLLDGRYYLGLGDFYKSTKKDFFGRSANSYIGIRLTYLFDIKK